MSDRRANTEGTALRRMRYSGSSRQRRRFRLRSALAPAGTVVEETSLSNVALGGVYCELTIGIGKDHTALLLVDLDACLANPQMFEEIEAA